MNVQIKKKLLLCLFIIFQVSEPNINVGNVYGKHTFLFRIITLLNLKMELARPNADCPSMILHLTFSLHGDEIRWS